LVTAARDVQQIPNLELQKAVDGSFCVGTRYRTIIADPLPRRSYNIVVRRVRTNRFPRQPGSVEGRAVSAWMQGNRPCLTISAIFPRALPAAARVDVRPVAVADGAKLSVVCFLFAGAWAALFAGALLPAF
jgi:hypothetical protein